MKATELMIGDWVQLNGLDVRVAAINERNDAGFLDSEDKIYMAYDGLDRIDPIPLTREIMCKNFGDDLELATKEYEVDIYGFSDGIWKVFVGCDTGDDSFQFYVRYLHELQHAFKLCGINVPLEP